MTKTAHDYENIVRRLRQEVAHLNDQLVQLHGEHNKRVHAMELVKTISDEAIAFTGRLSALDKVDEARLMPSVKRTIRDAAKLNRYFIDRARSIEAVTFGWPLPPEPERLVLDEDTGSDAGEGDIEGRSEEEHSEDAGQTVDSVDDTGSEEE